MSEPDMDETDKSLLSNGFDESELELYADPDNHVPKVLAVMQGSRPGSIVVGRISIIK